MYPNIIINVLKILGWNHRFITFVFCSVQTSLVVKQFMQNYKNKVRIGKSIKHYLAIKTFTENKKFNIIFMQI